MPCEGSAVQAAGLRKALEDAKRHMSVKTRDLQHLVSWQPPSALAACRLCSLQGPPPEACGLLLDEDGVGPVTCPPK